ncbi:MAG: efflux RND transporter periplasmic adaptor subunit [Pseudomonadales bacterium]|nr:efflux RND transporter periplasmic adaptor subunit [Pseudomonadales bacterium]
MSFPRTAAGRWITAFLGCLLLLLLLAAYKFLQIRQLMAVAAAYPEPSETVEAATVQQQLWQNTITTVGEVLAPHNVELRNEVEGRVIAVGFQAGAPVKKDQMLLQLDASEEIDQLRAAQADANLANATLSRYQKLAAQQVTSREQYDQARAQYAVAAARAQALQAVIDKKTITAPFDGHASLHHLQPGQYLEANTPITQLVGTLDTIWVDFFLPQQQGNIALNTAVNVRANAVFSNALHGVVTAIDPAISPTSRNFKLRATINNPPAALKPSTLVDVEVITAAARPVIAVPATAVQNSDSGHFVYVLESDENNTLRARTRTVTIGEEKNRSIVINNGLQAGERIATQGAYKLQPGMLVYIKDAAP